MYYFLYKNSLILREILGFTFQLVSSLCMGRKRAKKKNDNVKEKANYLGVVVGGSSLQSKGTKFGPRSTGIE